MTTLLTDIERFLDRHKMAATTFGALFGDRHFVRQVRAGRRVWSTTEAKVRQAMEEYEQRQLLCADNERPSVVMPAHAAGIAG
ncbi:hypothetical protein [Sphingomonas oryzagri]|uniref:Uncharacterized protein n=1 Tax=Sphingomonas oryzagri TaxID=3042314 RepID=A0ABT6N618_9SPHN|nr:hypothetical protein [Sphingomonas oryzagri]MDH7640545.1 hypothetical protein [Sphingomonas oryzagri]